MFAESLGSKVGQRLFLLFGACALVPLLALAAWVFTRGTSYLIEAERAELRADSKAYAMSLLDRIQLLESRLLDTAEILREGGGRRIPTTVAGDRFAALGILGPEQRYVPLIGDATAFDAADRALAGDTGDEAIHILSSEAPILAVAVGAGDDRLIVARPRRSYLWWGSTDESTLPTTTGMAILAPDRLLLSAGDFPRAVTTRLAEKLDHSVSGWLEWRADGETYLGGFWTLPLSMRFGSDDWTIVWFRERAAVLGPIEAFRRSLLLVLFASFLGIILLTVHQIRRTLKPLEVLKQGAQRLANQDFATRLEVPTEDEFREVAESFNDMAHRLGDLIAELDELQLGTLRSLARAIDEKSPWTHGHSERVAALAVQIAAALGMADDDRQKLHRAALLHDIGKLGISTQLLNKPAHLSPEEEALMQGHVDAGVRILEPLPGYEEVRPIIAQHHERVDGSGYPRGLQGDEILLEARIIAVADSYDALSSNRPYRARLAPRAVVAELRRGSGSLYDPEVIEAFFRATATDAGSTPAGVTPAPAPQA